MNYDLKVSTLLIVLCAFTVVAAAQDKLTLTTDMMVNESGLGDATLLVDEQSTAGDPLNGTGGSPSTKWFPGWSGSSYPAYVYIDLGEVFQIDHIFLRDINSTGAFTVSYGSPGSWTVLFTDNLTSYQTWNQHNVDVEARYLRFARSSAGANMAEIVLYGSELSVSDTIPPAAITQLSIDSVTTNTAYLSWLATGDDDTVGIATSYDIRYSAAPIDSANFESALVWNNSLSPAANGLSESVAITGLNSRTNYYFAVKVLDEALNISGISNVVNVETKFEIGGSPQQLMLTPEMVFNESAQGDASLLVDEQAVANDPANGTAGTPTNRWNPGNYSLYYPAYAFIDLGTTYNITKVFIHNDVDYPSADPITIYGGEPFNWDSLHIDSLAGGANWTEYQPTSLNTRYIRVKFHGKNTRMSEIALYGVALDSLEETTVTPISPERPFMEEFIGINAFVDDPLGRLEAVGHVREYHDWMWDEGNTSTSYPGFPNNENKFNPGASDWKFDEFYTALNNLSIEVFPSIKRNVLWLVNNQYNLLDNKPISTGESATSPSSYEEHADHMFQYAARYGAVSVADNLLKLASGQPRLTGAGLISYFENWNEHDRWWQYRADYFTPYEYAAMTSADYDGHQGSMGNTVGIINADSTAKMVMSGLARPTLDHIKAIKLWSDYNRNGDFPLDVINLHHYSNDNGVQGQGTVGISPEDDNLEERMKVFVDYRNAYLPDVEVWITEFGYDTHPSSIQRAPAIGSTTQNEVQGQWILRSFMALAAAGLEKASLYMLRDVNPNISTQYHTSGLTESKDSLWTPKPSWYYVYTLKNRLMGMKFDQKIAYGSSNVWVYKFKNPTNPQVAYVLWSPTSDGTVIENYQLNLGSGETTATKVDFVAGDVDGVDSVLTITSGAVTLKVTEKPIIVLADDGGTYAPLYQIEEKIALDTSMVVNESGLGDAWKLVDEQQLAGDAKYNNGGLPTSYWQPSWNNGDYPASCYIDLGSSKDITKLLLRDIDGTGDVTISYGEPGNWTTLITDDMSNYNVWKVYVEDISTRYIRVTKATISGKIAEIVLYGTN